MITFEDIVKNKEIKTYIEYGNNNLGVLGFTEHSIYHASKVANTAQSILKSLGCPQRECELAKIAGYMHDLGNSINRVNHAISGAQIAFVLLNKIGMEPEEIATIIGAIGNHDEGTGTPVSKVSAALILADKSDVRRSRVRNQEVATFDQHDRVNYAVTSQQLTLDKEAGQVVLRLCIDDKICNMMDYFEIFLERMLMCRRSADFLGLSFKLFINDVKVM